jgi:hypothetical protein
MSSPSRPRDHIGNEGVADNRYVLYKAAFDRYTMAMEASYFLEAVAIMESVISDRMESRLGELTGQDVGFQTLSALRDNLLGNKGGPKLEQDPQLEALYNRIVSDWAGKRNRTLHQFVKISQDGKKELDIFLGDSKLAAEEGRALFDALDKRLKQHRRNK